MYLRYWRGRGEEREVMEVMRERDRKIEEIEG